MTSDSHLVRLKQVLHDIDCRIQSPHRVWAKDSGLNDQHLVELADWAALEFLNASGTKITDASLPVLAAFPLQELNLADTALTATAILATSLPASLTTLGLSGINFHKQSLESFLKYDQLSELNLNSCRLSEEAVRQLLELPDLRSLEVFGAGISKPASREIAELYPQTILRFDDGVWAGGELMVRHRDPNEEEG